jgi:biopolymer transport protein ExbD
MLVYLPLNKPKAPVVDKFEKPAINIRIGGSGNKATLLLNDKPVNKKYLASRLIKESNGDESIPVEIAVAPAVYFKNVMKTLDEFGIANMRNVTFAPVF